MAVIVKPYNPFKNIGGHSKAYFGKFFPCDWKKNIIFPGISY